MSNPERLILAAPGNEELAERIAGRLGADWLAIEQRRFPDGESYVRLPGAVRGRAAHVVCTLSQPDEKLAPLLLAADAAREAGAARVGLVAPYLAYMRQDTIFKPGEAVSARAFAKAVSAAFDSLVTVEPHLHRIARLEEVYAIPCRTAEVAPLFADWIAARIDRPLLVGPDSESRQWVQAVAKAAGAPFTVMTKTRLGDRQVTIEAPDLSPYNGRRPVLVDDILSSGQTLAEAAKALVGAGFEAPYGLIVHALAPAAVISEVSEAFEHLAATNTAPSPIAEIDVSGILASAIETL
jgi:ribose-phosphate pyrophosphokinase